MYICVCVSLCMYVRLYIYVCMSVCVYLCMAVCVCILMYVCVDLCMYVVCVSLCVSVCVCAYGHMQMVWMYAGKQYLVSHYKFPSSILSTYPLFCRRRDYPPQLNVLSVWIPIYLPRSTLFHGVGISSISKYV